MAEALARRLKTFVRHVLSSAVYPRLNGGILRKCVFESGRAEIAQVEHQGLAYRFLIADRNDLIQSIHCGGALYEEEELEIIRGHFEASQAFVDVGANVGNHAMFAAVALAARRVVAVEPCLVQHSLLCVNALLNGCGERVEVHKVALSDVEGAMWIHGIKENIASANLRPMPSGELVRVACGDAVLGDIGPFFLKIDVEGHEMKVLDGLRGNIGRHRPKIFIEVSRHNADVFAAWVQAHGYRIAQRFRRYESVENFMLVPGP